MQEAINQYANWVYNHKGHSFIAATRPGIPVVDLRTQRQLYVSRAPRLLGKDGIDKLDEMLKELDDAGQAHLPLVLVLPLPLLVADTWGGHDHGDFWPDNQQGTQALLTSLGRHTPTRLMGAATVLSGDLHFGYAAVANSNRAGYPSLVYQFTSSAIKNSSVARSEILRGAGGNYEMVKELDGVFQSPFPNNHLAYVRIAWGTIFGHNTFTELSQTYYTERDQGGSVLGRHQYY